MLGSKSLGGTQVCHRHRSITSSGRRWCCRGQNAIAAVCLLIYGYIVRKTAKKIELSFDPAKDFLRRRQDFEVAKAVWRPTD